jgi:hypothetical protein
MQYRGVATVLIKATEEHCASHGVVIENRNVLFPLSWEDVNLVEALVDRLDTIGDELVTGLSSFHWVMDMKPRDELLIQNRGGTHAHQTRRFSPKTGLTVCIQVVVYLSTLGVGELPCELC